MWFQLGWLGSLPVYEIDSVANYTEIVIISHSSTFMNACILRKRPIKKKP